MSMAPLLGIPGKVKTLLDRLTAARATNLDNLDATVSTRAASATALSDAVWTGAKAAFLDKAVSDVKAGPFPVIVPKNLGTAYPAGYQGVAHQAPGWSGNGDYLTLGGTVAYYNNAGTQQWSKAATAINAACDHFAAYCYDNTDSLLYGVAVDIGTSPSTYYLFSINSSGTIVNIGNAAPTTDFNDIPKWTDSISTDTSGVLQRVADGSGNLWLRTTNGEEMEINVSTGAIVTDPANVFAVTGNDLCHKLADGNYISAFGGSRAPDMIYHDATEKTLVGINFVATDIGIKDEWKVLVWGDDVVLFSANGNAGGYIYTRTVFEAWIKDIKEASVGT